MSDTAGARRRVDAPSLGAIAIIVVVGAVSLQEISAREGFFTDLDRDINMCILICLGGLCTGT